MAHQHRVKNDNLPYLGWTQCVTPDKCAAKPGRCDAHGGVVLKQFCGCGASRQIEKNGSARNVGPWVEPQE